MVLFVEYIRKLMGWCPQQDLESMQFQKCSVHTSSSSVNPIRVSSKPAGRMDVPLYGTGGLGHNTGYFHPVYIFHGSLSF